MYATPDEAEAAFYTAFASANLDAMMEVWLDSESIVCVHPLGLKLAGREAVRNGWAELFRTGVAVNFRLADLTRTQDAMLSIHVLHEIMRVPPEPGERPPMTATNVYQFTDNGWRMLLHHAAPVAIQAPPAPPPRRHLH